MGALAARGWFWDENWRALMEGRNSETIAERVNVRPYPALTKHPFRYQVLHPQHQPCSPVVFQEASSFFSPHRPERVLQHVRRRRSLSDELPNPAAAAAAAAASPLHRYRRRR